MAKDIRYFIVIETHPGIACSSVLNTHRLAIGISYFALGAGGPVRFRNAAGSAPKIPDAACSGGVFKPLDGVGDGYFYFLQ